MFAANIVLAIINFALIVLVTKFASERNAARLNASRFQAQANEALAFGSKVSRDNDDLRERLREQGKTLSRRVRKAEGR